MRYTILLLGLLGSYTSTSAYANSVNGQWKCGEEGDYYECPEYDAPGDDIDEFGNTIYENSFTCMNKDIPSERCRIGDHSIRKVTCVAEDENGEPLDNPICDENLKPISFRKEICFYSEGCSGYPRCFAMLTGIPTVMKCPELPTFPIATEEEMGITVSNEKCLKIATFGHTSCMIDWGTSQRIELQYFDGSNPKHEMAILEYNRYCDVSNLNYPLDQQQTIYIYTKETPCSEETVELRTIEKCKPACGNSTGTSSVNCVIKAGSIVIDYKYCSTEEPPPAEDITCISYDTCSWEFSPDCDDKCRIRENINETEITTKVDKNAICRFYDGTNVSAECIKAKNNPPSTISCTLPVDAEVCHSTTIKWEIDRNLEKCTAFCGNDGISPYDCKINKHYLDYQGDGLVGKVFSSEIVSIDRESVCTDAKPHFEELGCVVEKKNTIMCENNTECSLSQSPSDPFGYDRYRCKCYYTTTGYYGPYCESKVKLEKLTAVYSEDDDAIIVEVEKTKDDSTEESEEDTTDLRLHYFYSFHPKNGQDGQNGQNVLTTTTTKTPTIENFITATIDPIGLSKEKFTQSGSLDFTARLVPPPAYLPTQFTPLLINIDTISTVSGSYDLSIDCNDICSVNGACDSETNICICKPGFTGPTCNDSLCGECLNGGKCIFNEETQEASCDCVDKEYDGIHCENFNPCSLQAESVTCDRKYGYYQLDNNEMCQCNCYSTHRNSSCTECSDTCMNNGIIDDSCTCQQCKPGFGGRLCECKSRNILFVMKSSSVLSAAESETLINSLESYMRTTIEFLKIDVSSISTTVTPVLIQNIQYYNVDMNIIADCYGGANSMENRINNIIQSLILNIVSPKSLLSSSDVFMIYPFVSTFGVGVIDDECEDITVCYPGVSVDGGVAKEGQDDGSDGGSDGGSDDMTSNAPFSGVNISIVLLISSFAYYVCSMM